MKFIVFLSGAMIFDPTTGIFLSSSSFDGFPSSLTIKASFSSVVYIKYSFLYTFVNWPRVYLEDHTLSMIYFIEWLLLSKGKG